jgi:mitochondrial translocator assembly and maintenance protein 41
MLPNVTIAKDDVDPSNTILQQDFTPTRRANMVARLPASFKAKLYRHYQRKFRITLSEVEAGKAYGGDFERRVASDEGLGIEVKKSIRETVGWVSFVQTVKGLFTAGMGRSVKYVWAKIEKWWVGQRTSSSSEEK